MISSVNNKIMLFDNGKAYDYRNGLTKAYASSSYSIDNNHYYYLISIEHTK